MVSQQCPVAPTLTLFGLRGLPDFGDIYIRRDIHVYLNDCSHSQHSLLSKFRGLWYMASRGVELSIEQANLTITTDVTSAQQ